MHETITGDYQPIIQKASTLKKCRTKIILLISILIITIVTIILINMKEGSTHLKTQSQFDQDVIQSRNMAESILEEKYLNIQQNAEDQIINKHKDDENQGEEEDESIEEAEIISSFGFNLSRFQRKALKYYIRQLNEFNPGQSVVTKQNLSFLTELKTVQQLVNKTEEQIVQLEEQTRQTHSKLLKVVESKKNANFASPPNDSSIALLGLFEIYNQLGFKVQLTEESIHSSESFSLQFQQQMILTGQTEDMKYVEFQVDSYKSKSYEQLISDSTLRNKFIQHLKSEFSIILNIKQESIVILDIMKIIKGSIIVQMHIPPISIEDLENLSIQVFKKFDTHAVISIKTLIDYFEISPSLFSPEYNMYWDDSFTNIIDYRGSLPMKINNAIQYQPQRYQFPVGYQGYGINVKRWLTKGSQWFEMDSSPNTWIVLYHGTSGQAVLKILQDFIKPGINNAYGNQICRITGQSIKAGQYSNTYLSDDVKEANQYTREVTIGSSNYVFIFQCRVNPNHVRSPQITPSYYTVSDEFAKESIRPYRLLIKKI